MLVRGYRARNVTWRRLCDLARSSKGRQMPSHKALAPVKRVSGRGIGPQLPHAVGMALAADRKRGQQRHRVGRFGRCATSGSDFPPSLKFCGFFARRDVLYVKTTSSRSECRRRQSGTRAGRKRQRAYGSPGEPRDGNDARAVLAAIAEAAERVRRGEPAVLECLSLPRFLGPHSSSTIPAVPATKRRQRDWAERDTIALEAHA